MSHRNVCGGNVVTVWYADGRSNSTKLPFSKFCGFVLHERSEHELTFYSRDPCQYWRRSNHSMLALSALGVSARISRKQVKSSRSRHHVLDTEGLSACL